MNELLLILSLSIFGTLTFYAYTRWIPIYYARRDTEVPAPAAKRTDLLFGYYGALGEQIAETKDHVNLFWSIQFEGIDKLVQNIREAAMPTVIDVSHQMTERDANGKAFVRGDASRRLHELLSRLEAEGVLHHVIGFTPGDEPNSQFRSVLDWSNACSIIRIVCTQFSALADVKIVLLLNGAAPMENWVPHGDWIGFNCYNRKSSIFQQASKWPPKWDGEYTKLRKWLRPDQRTFLVPGGGYKHDLTPWINAAHTYPEVAAVVVFAWADFPITDEYPDYQGVRSSSVKDAYIAAGRSIVGAA